MAVKTKDGLTERQSLSDEHLHQHQNSRKTLQFGQSKCKSMFVGKSSNILMNPDLHVDSWRVFYEDNIGTGDLDLIESYEGPVIMEKTTAQKYLGFVLSNTGDNMVNIRDMKTKSLGIIRQKVVK